MFRTTAILAAALTIAAAAPASAHRGDIALGKPGYGGNGCPAGTLSATLSPDRKSLSLIFDQFLAEAGGSSGRRMDRKSCNIAVPVHVPQGFSVSVFQIDYRGFVAQPRGARSTFNVEYFFAGSRGPRFTKNFAGRMDRDYLLRNKLVGVAHVWSRCGADVNLRVNTNMRTKTNRRGGETMATVDSADLSAGIVYHLRWRRCS